MKRSKFSEERIFAALKLQDTGIAVGDICRELGISQQTFYQWKKRYAGLPGATEAKRLRELEKENAKLKKLVADLSLDRHVLQEIIAKKL